MAPDRSSGYGARCGLHTPGMTDISAKTDTPDTACQAATDKEARGQLNPQVLAVVTSDSHVIRSVP